MPKPRSKGVLAKLKGFFFGHEIMSFKSGNRRISVKKKILTHKIHVDGKPLFSVQMAEEGEILRLTLLNHKDMDLHLLPKIAEDMARKLKKKEVKVEVFGSELDQHLESNGFRLEREIPLIEEDISKSPTIVPTMLPSKIFSKKLKKLKK